MLRFVPLSNKQGVFRKFFLQGEKGAYRYNDYAYKCKRCKVLSDIKMKIVFDIEYERLKRSQGLSL